MDFSTMRKKITQDEYSNLSEFRADCELMCENAMKYNRSETIYWQAAKKLAASVAKLLHRDKLLNLRRTQECFSRLTERELGFRLDSTNHTNDEQTLNPNEPTDSSVQENENLLTPSLMPRITKSTLKLPRYYEKLPTLLADEEEDEELSPEEILSQAQQAAQCAREKLSLRRPVSAYTLSCQRPNGTTSLRFINQDELSAHQAQTRTITIGELSNLPSSAGAPTSNAYHPQPTTIVNETEKRNHLLPRYFLDYGSFSSHAPQYDSSFTSLSKDELDSLIHTYGSEFSAQQPVSVIDYVKDSGDLALSYVDRCLSVPKNGENDSSTKKADGKGQSRLEIDLTSNEPILNGSTHHSPSGQVKIELPASANGNRQKQLDMKLDETARLLVQLRQAQHDRLCQPSNRIHQIIPSQQPSEPLNEGDLAEKVLTNLSDMTHMSSAGPAQVISPAVIRHNLGIVTPSEPTALTSMELL